MPCKKHVIGIAYSPGTRSTSAAFKVSQSRRLGVVTSEQIKTIAFNMWSVLFHRINASQKMDETITPSMKASNITA